MVETAASSEGARRLCRFGGRRIVDSGVGAERLRARVADHIYLVREGLQARVSASVGLAIFPGDAEDAATLMARADAAMYQAKRTGKNRVVQAATMPAGSSRNAPSATDASRTSISGGAPWERAT